MDTGRKIEPQAGAPAALLGRRNGKQKFINLPQRLVPVGAGEGTVLSIEIDVNETKRRQDIISDLMNKVWND